MLLRATLGFAIAFAVYAPQKAASFLDMPALSALKADIAADRPREKLMHVMKEQLRP